MDGGTGYGAFRDSEQDLETMRRYEAFLQLQMDADGLTDEEYLARLDSISGGDPSELMHGAEAYGSEDAEKMAADAAVRDATELADKYGYERADGAATEIPAEKHESDGTKVHTAEGAILEEDPEAAEVPEESDDSERSGNSGDALETKSDDGIVPGMLHRDSMTIQADAEAEKDVGYEEPEAPEAQRVLEDGTPVGPVIVPDDEDVPEKKQPGPEGRFVPVHEYHVDDALDAVALGTGTLAGAVVGYDYVPPVQPAPASGQQKQMTPNLAAMYREMQRTEEREAERQLGGPSR